MSQTAQIVRMERIRPVKWSAIDKKVDPYRVGFVNLFFKFEGRPLLNEDGSPMMSEGARPRHREVTASAFAKRYGIANSTFAEWVVNERGVTQPWQQRPVSGRSSVDPEGIEDEKHGQCHHCPGWTEGR